MTQKEKENRIHSFALEFLERQQIVPNLYADQIIKGYKEGYLQAEQDFEAKEVDLELEQRIKECPFRQVVCNKYENTPVECDCNCSWVVDYPKLKELKAQKG